MFVRNAVLFKWSLYGLTAAACMALQGMVLHRFHLWGVIPFLYPLLAVIPATFEGPAFGTAFALALGVVCDCLLPGHIPCLYTLAFPLCGQIAARVSKEMLPAGIVCSYAVSAGAFAVHGLLQCFFLWASGKAAWSAGAYVTARELVITLPLAVPLLTWIFRAVADRVEYVELRNG